MKFTEPQVEWWQQTSLAQHIARVGRICYKAKGKQPGKGMTEEEVKAFIQKRDEERCKGLWESGHRSMYRHGTIYIFMPHEKGLPNYIWAHLNASPYIDYATKNHKVWISTNMQFLLEHKNLMDALNPYNVSEDEFIEKAQKYECEEAFTLIRMTMVVTTQRIQGESYNRKSPNCIAEQSTRYVNLSRKGGVQICRPHWEEQAKWYQLWASHFGYWVAEKVYKFLIFTGLKPEDARGNLTFNTYTICGYTYTLSEWKHILDMRLRNKTGIAHPDASIVAKQISRIINDRMQQYIPSFEI